MPGNITTTVEVAFNAGYTGVVVSYLSEVLADTPYLYWRLGESSGTVADDASGNGRTGTYTASPTLGQASLIGDADTSVLFDGSTQNATTALTAVADTAITLEGWYKGTATSGIIVARDNSAAPKHEAIVEVNGGDARFTVHNAASTLTASVTGPTINDNVRHHVVGTYDGTTTRLYVDGVEVGTPATNVTGTLTSTAVYFITGSGRASNGNLAGTVDEVAWYQTALSAARIAAHYAAGAASPTWTDVTAYVEPGGVDIQRGRQNEMSEVSASTCGLTLDNRDGRFTPEYAGGAYYPNVKKGRPIRVRTSSPGNLIAYEESSFESGPLWTAAGGGGIAPSVGRSSAQAWDGTYSCEVTWTGGGGSPLAQTIVTLTIGQQYTLSAYLYVPTGGPNVRLNWAGSVSSTMSTKDAWTRVSVTRTATTTSNTLTLQPLDPADAGICYIDAVQLETGASASAFKGPVSLFTGYVDEWPVEWPGGSDAMATASIKATSRMARLSLGLPYRSIVEEEILADDPVLYWPLGEPEGATEAGNIAAGRAERLVVTQMGSGGTLAFGAGTGPGTDDLTAPIFTPVDDVNGKTLVATLSGPVIQATDTVAHLEAWVVTSSTAFSYYVVCTSDNDLTTSAGLGIGVQAGTGKAFAVANAPPSAPGVDGIQVQTNSPGSVANGNLHHLVGTFTRSGSNIAVDITVDGVETSGASTPWGTSAFPSHTKVIVGGTDTPSQPSPFPGTIAHAAIYSGTTAVTDARFVQHYNVGTTATYTEASGARIARYARLAGIPTAEISTETGLSTSIAHRDTTGQSAIQMMQDVAHTEDGVVFDGKDGTLTFHARSHRYAATTAFTLSCADGEVEPNLAPVLDDQGMLNDVTASREGGATARSVNQASIDEYGVYRDTVELMTTSDNEVQSRADWEVNRRATPRVKLTAVTVDAMVASDAQAALILAADIGTRFTVEDLPVQAPATSMDFFVEGITYDIADDRFVVTFNTSAAVLSTVWILDSATLSQLDSTTVLAY